MDSCNGFGFIDPPAGRAVRSGPVAPAQPPETKATESEIQPFVEEQAVTVDPVKPKASITKKKATTVKKEKPAVKAPAKDPHIKIVVHSTNNCPYCVQMLETLKAFEDKYEIVEEKHDGSFRPAYSYYYVQSFPYVEYLYDGKVKLYHYGKRTEEQVQKLIEQISR